MFSLQQKRDCILHLTNVPLFPGAMMSVDETLMCSFQILKPADKKKFPYGGLNSGRPVTKMNKK